MGAAAACLACARLTAYPLFALPRQVGQTTLYFPKGLKAVYGNQMACEFGKVLSGWAGHTLSCGCLPRLMTCFVHEMSVLPAGAYMGGYLVLRGKAAKSSDTKTCSPT